MEGKNGAVVRKHIGYGAIAAEHASALQRFYTAYFNPYLNYHRPCGFATIEITARGQRRRRYRATDYRTPYEKLLSLPTGKSTSRTACEPRRSSSKPAATATRQRPSGCRKPSSPC